METDFLNFHDEEHFSALGSQQYQQGTLLDDYRHYADDYIESSSSYWELDEEQELNGDIAVIPVSGRLDREIPYFSTSPGVKDDFTDEWHYGTIEERDELSIIVALSGPKSPLDHVAQMPIASAMDLEVPHKDVTNPVPENIFATAPAAVVPPNDITAVPPRIPSCPQDIPSSHFPAGQTDETTGSPCLSDLHLSESPLKHLDITDPDLLLNTSFDKDLKNLDLITAVTNDDIDLDLNLHLSPTKLPPVDFELNLKEPFDLTSYINDDHDTDPIIPKGLDPDDPLLKGGILSEPRKSEEKSKKVENVKSKPIFIKNKNHEQVNLTRKDSLQIDIEDDCIDVETVSPSDHHPVLEAKDVKSLLEQFEANEVVNASTHSDHTYQTAPSKIKVNKKKRADSDTRKSVFSERKSSFELKNLDKKQKEVVEKIKANEKRKTVPVIPAIPKTKPVKDQRNQEKKLLGLKNKAHVVDSSPSRESIQLDHDYCTVTHNKAGQASTSSKDSNDLTHFYNIKRKQELVNCGIGIGSKGIRCTEKPIDTRNNDSKVKNTTITKQIPQIEDTALRIQDKSSSLQTIGFSPLKNYQFAVQNKNNKSTIQSKIHPNSLLKSDVRMQHSLLTVNQKSMLFKTTGQTSLLKPNINQIKNADGKLMVSVLKSNIKSTAPTSALSHNKVSINTVIETKTSSDKCIQNIIVTNPKENEDSKRPKKRKLNLEEYKKRREINKTRSCNNSRTNSPINTPGSGNSSPMVNHGSFSLPVTAIGSPASQPSTPLYEPEPKKTATIRILSPQELLLKMAADLLTTPAKSTQPPPGKDTICKMEPFTPPNTDAQDIKPIPAVEQPNVEFSPPKPCNDDIEMVTIVSIGVNTDLSMLPIETPKPNVSTIDNKVQFQFMKKFDPLPKNKYFETGTSESEDMGSPKKTMDANIHTHSNLLVKQLNLDEDRKLKDIITPILQNASTKINSNSLISNITATILQKNTRSLLAQQKATAKISPTIPKRENDDVKIKSEPGEKQLPPEHGEDKTVIALNKNRIKPKTASVETQTDPIDPVVENKTDNDKQGLISENKSKRVRQYRSRRDSCSSSSSTETSLSRKSHPRKSCRTSCGSVSRSLRTSVSSLESSRYSRSSRSRSDSRSLSRSSYSSSSSSDRSRTRSRSSSRRRRVKRHSRCSSDRYFRARRRSKSNHSYRHYRRSRSPLKRSSDRSTRSWEPVDQETYRPTEERRVIYVGRLLPGTTKNELKRRFSVFGPIVDVSVHFRDKGDNYGFVTFQYKIDAYEAIERGNEDPNLPQYDISFGERRAFCKTRYSDLDNADAIELGGPGVAPGASYSRPSQEDSFDILLKEVQAKMLKRKV